MAKALYNEGASVFGWDMEWNMDYNINRYRYGGSAMFYRLNPKGGKLPGKIVVLTHDIAHRYRLKSLIYFLKMLFSDLEVTRMLRQSCHSS